MIEEVADVKVRGVNFRPEYPHNLNSLRESLEYDVEPTPDARANGIGCWLERDPDNEHDSNAIQVHVDLGSLWDSFVGHLPATMCRWLAPSMDRGDEWVGRVLGVAINPDWPDRPGLRISLERKRPQLKDDDQ